MRSSLHRAVPWVRSVVLCAKVYNAEEPYSTQPAPPGSGWIGRYAWSGAAGVDAALRPTDYHDVLLARLHAVEAALQQRHGAALQTRCYVDTGPVVERHLAQLAGIGWIGKNTCVLNQQLGSWMLLGTLEPEVAPAAAPEPQAEVRSASAAAPLPVDGGSWAQTRALLRYLTQTDVHTYAFSVAANVILSLFPFIVLLLTLSQQVFHSDNMRNVVGQLMHSFLPTGQDFVMRNMALLAHPRKGAQAFSFVMLIVSSTGVFLPLEVALNKVWLAEKNRSYLHNQAVSLGLAMAVGVLAMLSVAISAGQQAVLGFVFLGHTDNIVFALTSRFFLSALAGLSSIAMFFLIYWILPNRRVPARAVLPTAIVTGMLWEIAKHLYIAALPVLDFQRVYGPFYISVGLMMWAFLSGLILLAGARFSATRHALRLAAEDESAAGGVR